MAKNSTITASYLAEKILYEHEFFGHQRFMAQISVGALPHEKVMRAIELFGAEGAPVVRKALVRRPVASLEGSPAVECRDASPGRSGEEL